MDSFSKMGIHLISVSYVDNPLMMPYCAQKMTETCKAIFASSIVTHDAIGNGSLSQSIISSLLQVGVISNIPVFPALVCLNNLIEIKATIPQIVENWVNAFMKLTVMESSGIVVEDRILSIPPVKVTLSPSELNVDNLLLNFRSSLSVILFLLLLLL